MEIGPLTFDLLRSRLAELHVLTQVFEGEEALLHVIERIVVRLGLRVDGSSPWVDARLQDGSLVQT
jgi:Flp pilus assembly CpaF family ATPase